MITVNYNGAHLLPGLLHSLQQQTYRNHEILVVDNGSTDGSLDLLERDFPWTRVLRLTENAGFSGGNNAGILASRGDFVALVNNDTVADPSWLEELVRTACSDPTIAAVGSKILFFRPFLPVHLTVEDSYTPSREDGYGPEQSGVLVGEESAFAGCDYRKPIFREGFPGSEILRGQRAHRMAYRATVFLPIRGAERDLQLRLFLAVNELAENRKLRVKIGSTRITTLALEGELREYPIDIPATVVESEAFDVINNAGTSLSSDGDAADRGIYEPDRGQYDRAEDVEALCGAALLLRCSALKDVGLLDRDFFMYYEDADLSWRLRARGFRLRYEPRSTIRHLHATSSVEWSPLFTYYTVRNKVLMIAKNARLRALVRVYAVELRSMIGLFRALWRSRGGAAEAARARRELATRLRVHLSLLALLPLALLKRLGWARH